MRKNRKMVGRRKRVLIVEDDRNIAALVSTYLEQAGFDTAVACDGERGLELARSMEPALVVLDVMLPNLDGFSVCRELRKSSDVPILMLSARSDEVDRVLGFSLFADDYVVKPFSPRELVERVKAILRRTKINGARDRKRLEFGKLMLDTERHVVTLEGERVELTALEFRLLHTLVSAPGRVFSRQELLDQWPQSGAEIVDRAVDVHIGKLRHKLGDNPADPRFIFTVRGVGYRFANDEE
jgi:DNA-binding response OmpR family regulator